MYLCSSKSNNKEISMRTLTLLPRISYNKIYWQFFGGDYGTGERTNWELPGFCKVTL